MQCTTVPQCSTGDPEVFPIAAKCNRVWGVSLKLDSICPRFLGSLKYAYRLLEILVMVRGELSHNVSRMTRPHQSTSNFQRLCNCRHVPRKSCWGNSIHHF